MDEIVVRLARVLASWPRLRILSLLARSRELPPTKLATELRMPLNVLSAHLHSLATAGLIVRRKSGPWSPFHAGSPYAKTTPSGKLVAWLQALLRDAEATLNNPGLREVRDYSGSPETRLHRIIFEAATAFTDLRRLQILRWLTRRSSATVEQMREALSISPQALSRHLAKLGRRGYVQFHRKGKLSFYALNPTPKTVIHQRLLEIIQATCITART